MQKANSDIPTHSIVAEIETILGSWLEKLQAMPPLTKMETRDLSAREWEEKHRGKS